ncbi:MAG: metallophosphoesterase [Ignavibacteria bacterium]|nr:metallophosphoesterase [Ignavibacteria bacterium]
MTCFFVSDLHGRRSRYEALFDAIESERPDRVFIGGDLFAGGLRLSKDAGARGDFVQDFLAKKLRGLRDTLRAAYPRVYVIAGNDDPRSLEPTSARWKRRNCGPTLLAASPATANTSSRDTRTFRRRPSVSRTGSGTTCPASSIPGARLRRKAATRCRSGRIRAPPSHHQGRSRGHVRRCGSRECVVAFPRAATAARSTAPRLTASWWIMRRWTCTGSIAIRRFIERRRPSSPCTGISMNRSA